MTNKPYVNSSSRPWDEDGGLFRPESTRINVSAPEGLFCSRLYPSLFVSSQNPIWISNIIEYYQVENVLNGVKI